MDGRLQATIGIIAIGAAITSGNGLYQPDSELYVARITDPTGCAQLGEIQASDIAPNRSAALAHALARRKVAAKGGNAYAVITEQYNPIASAVVIRANALHCQR